jgi:peptidoglycan/LPS O-acetylase OafA/YrhL
MGVANIIAITFGRARDDGHVQAATTPIFLGSYRLLLAFFVFCSHSVWPLVHTVTHDQIGGIAVLCFFIVSGYLITLTIEVHYASSVRRYVINRFLRIYPTFWVSMLVATAAILSMGTTYVAESFYLRGWTWDNVLRCILIFPAYGGNKTWGPIPVGWALQVEVCFYLIMAALYLAIGRLPHRTRHIVVMCFCCACFVVYVVPIALTKHLWGNGFLFAPFFGAGVMTAIISRLETDQHSMRLCAGLILATLLALCVTVLFFMLSPVPDTAMRGTVTFSVVCGLFYFLLLPAVASHLVWFKRIDTLLGDLTYPVYTLHFPLNQVTAFWLYSYLGPPTVFIQLGITIAAAYLLLRFVDRPLSALRNRVRECDDPMPGRNGAPIRLANVTSRMSHVGPVGVAIRTRSRVLAYVHAVRSANGNFPHGNI